MAESSWRPKSRRELECPLDVLVVRKIGAPNQKELAIGAVTNGSEPRYVLNDELIEALGVTRPYLNAEIAQEYIEVQRRQQHYRQGQGAVPVQGKSVIIVDDGIATGATVRAGITALRDAGAARLVLAVPVAASESLQHLSTMVDEIVCLSSPMNFMSVGRFYANFNQTTDEEVITALAESTSPN